MKLAMQRTPAGTRPIVIAEDGEARVVAGVTDLDTIVRSGLPVAQLQTDRNAGSPGVLDAPLRPGKIVAIGLNYRDHAREAGIELPSSPLVFAKFPSAVVGPTDDIVIDEAITARVDWEVELAVVIGRSARRVPEDEALEHVFGYTVANDVSARDVQFADGQWIRGKSLDTFCPIGPVIVTRDEIPDPSALSLRTRVNGETMQNSSTSEMVFSVAQLISYCSLSFTLNPGDLLLTGTPWGCGEFMDPQRSLKPGDIVETEIHGIGINRNTVRAAAP